MQVNTDIRQMKWTKADKRTLCRVITLRYVTVRYLTLRITLRYEYERVTSGTTTTKTIVQEKRVYKA